MADCIVCNERIELTLPIKTLKRKLFEEQVEELPDALSFVEETAWIDSAIPPQEVRAICEKDKAEREKEKRTNKLYAKAVKAGYNADCTKCREWFDLGSPIGEYVPHHSCSHERFGNGQ